MQESLYARMRDDAGISAIASARVFPLKADQDAVLPLVIYQTIGGVPEHTMVADGGVRGTRVQIASWARTHAEALSLAMAVNTCLKDFSGVMGGSGGVTVSRIFEETDIYDDFDDTAEVEGLWVVRQDFTIWYE